jgi:inhibitor of KinA sporulation pathway (predicted exonuclease)
MPRKAARAGRKAAIVFDLEFTAWEGSRQRRWSLEAERTELVQIGAVKLDAETLRVLDEFEMLVQPRLNPRLSDYLVDLTGITNAALAARGVDFVTAYRAFLDFTGAAHSWAFGRDDLIFAENLKLYGWDKALPAPHYHNVIPWFAENGVDLSGKHACDVAEAAGGVFTGRRHDALADAHGVAVGMATLIGKGAPNPLLLA